MNTLIGRGGPLYGPSCRSDTGSEIKYEVHTVAPILDAVRSIGGFRTLPDYSFENMPKDHAALILIGGNRWYSP